MNKLDLTKDVLEIDKCPECGMQWRYEQDGQVFSKIVGIEHLGKYDGVGQWHCIDCKSTWNRWSGERSE